MKSYLLRSVSARKVADAGGEELKSGFLMKKGKVNKAYKQRWSVLRDDKNLYYYRSPEDTRPAGVIDISQAVVVPAPGEDNDCAFQIITTSRVFYVLASDQAELDAWLSILNFTSLLSSENEKIETAEAKIKKAAAVKYNLEGTLRDRQRRTSSLKPALALRGGNLPQQGGG